MWDIDHIIGCFTTHVCPWGKSERSSSVVFGGVCVGELFISTYTSLEISITVESKYETTQSMN